LYIGVVPVTRQRGGALELGGSGEPIDWLVEMARFDQDTLFDRLAERRCLEPGLMESLADAVATLHAQAEVCPDRGGREGMAWVIDGNALGLDDQGDAELDRAACEQLTAAGRDALQRHAGLLERRRREGAVRRCHGDLHLGNICLVEGVPTLFDGIEFNDQLACIDVWYDVAFLLMDLWHRELRDHANIVFNQYVSRTSDLDGLSLLPLFLSCRAAVRTKTQIAAARVQPDAAHARSLRAAARAYLSLALASLDPPPPLIVAVGGFSGSGKSTLARSLAPALGAPPGALVVRSDLVRKRLMGVSPLTRLGPEGYTPQVSKLVYHTMAERCRVAVAAGRAVIVDAVFADPGERATMAGIARAAGVSFCGFWLEGRPETLEQRLRDRVADASDATVDVLEHQRQAGAGDLDWLRLDGSRSAGDVRRQAEEALGKRPSP
jgi:hypothetical protein